MNIPNDAGGTWRWDKLVELYRLEAKIQDDPSPSKVLALWADENLLTPADKIWLSYLYGLTYSTTTAILIFRHFPKLGFVEVDDLESFWRENKQRLYFNRDRRYIKNNDQFVKAIIGLQNLEHSNRGLRYHLTTRTDEQIYQRIVKNWPYFGRHAAFLFFDAYSKMFGECTLSSISNWNEAHTIAEGLALATYDDELYQRAKSKHLTPGDAKILDALVVKIEQDCGANFTDIESTICAYAKLFKGTRYLGYYIDRFQEELKHARENDYPEEDMLLLWKLRSEVSPPTFLGEYMSWSGIRKDRCKLWLKEGRLI